MNTKPNRFKVTFVCGQKQLGDICVALAPHKVSDFDFGLIVDVPYSENSKSPTGISAAFREFIDSNATVSRGMFMDRFRAMGFSTAQVNNAITRFKKMKKLKLVGDNVVSVPDRK